MPWELTGNSGTNPSNDFLGTADAQPLAIRTNGAEVMRVSAQGDLGIGTSSPRAGLEIEKGATNNVALMVSSSGPGWGSGIQLRNVPAAGGGKTFGIYAGFGQLHFADVDNAVDRLIVDSSGRIGIGTSGAPRAGLEIDKGATNDLALMVSSSGPGWGSGIAFRNVPATGGGKTYGIYAGFGQLHFTDVDNSVDRLIIESSGRISILGELHLRGPGLRFPDGSLQTTATLQGQQGPPGPPGPPVSTSAVCVGGSPAAAGTNLCSCSGRLVSRVFTPCSVTSNTGGCNASSAFTSTGAERAGSCCVCAPA